MTAAIREVHSVHAIHTRRTDGAPPVLDPAAPAILHIDLADTARMAAAAPPAHATEIPRRTAMDAFLVDEARKVVAGETTVVPRVELLAAVLREVDRQQWWRDEAERKLQEETARARAHEAVAERRSKDRHQLLGIVFELVAFAAQKLNMPPKPDAVLQRIRALGSGHLQPGPLPSVLTGERP